MKSDFPASYASNNSVEVLATVLALNLATATFLIGGFLNLEGKAKITAFDNARREIRHNLYAMAILFGFNLILAAMVGKSTSTVFSTNIQWTNVFSTLTVSVLFFYVYLLMEIIRAAFKLKAPTVD